MVGKRAIKSVPLTKIRALSNPTLPGNTIYIDEINGKKNKMGSFPNSLYYDSMIFFISYHGDFLYATNTFFPTNDDGFPIRPSVL